ncbi:MAG: nickel-dependent malate racemase, LarAH6 family [Saccharofermentanales bacterium]
MSKKHTFTLGYGKQSISVTIKAENLLSELKANKVPIRLTGEEEVLRALSNPIGTPRLGDIVQKGESVCIVTSDITRPCPSDILLPPVIAELMDAGINPEDITVVFALGSHRRHTEEEMRKITGDEVYELVHTIDSDPEDIVLLGYTGRSTPVNITASVARADRRICLGNIEMHYFAGYSGGAKAIMPGVSNRESIQANHRMMTEETSAAGHISDNNIRLDIEEAGDICGIDFILNVVLDENKNIVRAVAGDHRLAHRAGCEFLDSLYKIRIPRLADIVIASPGGYPKDINLYQAQKALDNAQHAVRTGGIIILAADCSEGFGEDVFEDWLCVASSTSDLVERIRCDFRLGGHKAAAIAMVVEKCSEVLFVTSLAPDIAAKSFMKPYADIQDALDYAIKAMGAESKVIIMSHAGSTLPTL